MNETNIVIYDILIEVSVLQDRSNKSRTRVEGLDLKTFCPALPASVRGTKIICRGSRQLQVCGGVYVYKISYTKCTDIT